MGGFAGKKILEVLNGIKYNKIRRKERVPLAYMSAEERAFYLRLKLKLKCGSKHF